ncbi:MAG: phosphatase PAP2 family protein, partial [Mycobacterium sp.]
SQGLKHILDLPRPAAVLDPVAFNLVGPRYRHNSFPSGHTVTAFVWVCAFIPYLEARWARLGGLAVAAIIGLSRVAVGAHWPLDIAGGAALGVASSLAAHRLLAIWRGGFRVSWHLALVALVSCAAMTLFVVGVPYAEATGLAYGLATLGLGTSGWHYLLRPRLALAQRRRRNPAAAARGGGDEVVSTSQSARTGVSRGLPALP